MSWLGEASEHDADHSEANERRGSSCIGLEVAREASVMTDPCEG